MTIRRPEYDIHHIIPKTLGGRRVNLIDGREILVPQPLVYLPINQVIPGIENHAFGHGWWGVMLTDEVLARDQLSSMTSLIKRMDRATGSKVLSIIDEFRRTRQFPIDPFFRRYDKSLWDFQTTASRRRNQAGTSV